MQHGFKNEEDFCASKIIGYTLRDGTDVACYSFPTGKPSEATLDSIVKALKDGWKVAAIEYKKPGNSACLPVMQKLVAAFGGSHPLDVALAVAHWVHTPDCSPRARQLIRAACRLDGSTAGMTGGFGCSFCCDSGRVSGVEGWQPCPECKD